MVILNFITIEDSMKYKKPIDAYQESIKLNRKKKRAF